MKIIQVLKWKDEQFKIVWHDADDFNNLLDKNITQSYGVCFYQGKLLVAKNNGNWSLVGGHIENGEKPEETLIREVKEESNMEVLEYRPIGYQEVVNPNGKIDYQLRYFCKVKPIGEFTKDPAGSVTEIKMIDPKSYKKYFNWGKIGDRMMKIGLYNLLAS